MSSMQIWNVGSDEGAGELQISAVRLLLDALTSVDPAANFHAFLNEVAEVDYLTHVRYTDLRDGKPTAPELLAGHAAPDILNNIQQCFAIYRERFWKQDECTALAQRLSRDESTLSLFHFTPGDVSAPPWRRTVYRRMQLADRLTLLYSAAPGKVFGLNMYRTRRYGEFRPDEIARVRAIAPLLRQVHRGFLISHAMKKPALANRLESSGKLLRQHLPELSPRQGVVILRPQWNLTIFKIHFGLLTLKAYSKGERVLRFEAIVHNTKTLRTGRALGKFGAIVARLAGMVDRFTTMLDCIDTGFLPDGILDQLPTPTQTGAVRVGGIDTDKPRTRAAMAAVTALSIAPDGFSVADLAATVHARTGQDYTTRQAAYDLRKLRGKNLVVKPGRGRRYQVPDDAARTLSAILTLRDRVIAPVLAGVRKPVGRPRNTYTRVDRDYDTLRYDMRALFTDLGIATAS